MFLGCLRLFLVFCLCSRLQFFKGYRNPGGFRAQIPPVYGHFAKVESSPKELCSASCPCIARQCRTKCPQRGNLNCTTTSLSSSLTFCTHTVHSLTGCRIACECIRSILVFKKEKLNWHISKCSLEAERTHDACDVPNHRFVPQIFSFFVAIDDLKQSKCSKGPDNTLANGHSRRAAKDEFADGCKATRNKLNKPSSHPFHQVQKSEKPHKIALF